MARLGERGASVILRCSQENPQRACDEDLMAHGVRAELTGRRFGRLTVVAYDRGSRQGAMWQCQCDCGGKKSVPAYRLIDGITKSCGCMRPAQLKATSPDPVRRRGFQRKEALDLAKALGLEKRK